MNAKHTITCALVAGTSLITCSTQAIETISITGSRLPLEQSRLAGSVSVIDADQIRASGALNISDILRGLNGISLAQSGPAGSLTELRLRGAESNHVLVLIDGIEVNDVSQGGLVDLSHLSTDDIQRIELIRGPQSALWGSGALAGVLSITTTSPGENQGRLKVELGEHNTEHLNGRYAGASESISFSLNASHFDTDGQNISRQGSERDGYRRTHVAGAITADVTNNSTIKASARHTDFETDFDAVDFFETGLPVDADNRTDGTQTSAQLQWDYAPQNSQWQQSLGWQFHRNENDNTVGGQPDSETEGEKQRLFWLNTWQYAPLGRASLLLEQVDEDFVQRGPIGFGDPNQRQSNQIRSVALDWIHSLSDHFSLNASWRHDNNDEFDNASSYRAGFSYLPIQDVRLYASYGKGVKNPSFVERFGFFPADFIGNPDLKPEHAATWEVGTEWQLAKNWQTSLTWFDSELENEINGFVFDPDSLQFTADNVDGTSLRQGVEFELTGTWGEAQISAVYSYLDATEPDAAGQQQTELRRARHSGSVQVNLPLLQDKANLFAQASYTGSRFDTFFPPFPQSPETLKLSPYTVVNAGASYSIDAHWTLSVRAENLLDEKYEDVIGFVSPGRSAYLGVGVDW